MFIYKLALISWGICFNIHPLRASFTSLGVSTVSDSSPISSTKHIVGAREIHLEEMKKEDVELPINIHLPKPLNYSFIC